MKVLAICTVPGHEEICAVASPWPPDDPDARRITLRTMQTADAIQAGWLITQYLESVVQVIAEEGWETALSRFVDEDWTAPTAALRLIEDPGNILGPGPEVEVPSRRH
jgi:hypothetical protein